jgi:hypothetical protein
MCLNIDDILVDITVPFVYSSYTKQVSTNKEINLINEDYIMRDLSLIRKGITNKICIL